MTYFELFGLTPSALLDVRALEQKHRELSLAHHPDRHTGADAKTRLKALELTTALNDAFKVLRDPERRAFYLLKLQGVDLESERGAARATMPQRFLEEVLDRREALEEAIAQADVPKVQAMGTLAQAQRKEALRLAQEALARNDAAEATHQLGRVRYYARFVEEVEAFEDAQGVTP